ncbi:MAG: PDZ domain-containing protein, partial [Gammaproteobacteria bacterium]|nr:PDZ domain-containing protein [Gammaproteobacteria bacterium]
MKATTVAMTLLATALPVSTFVHAEDDRGDTAKAVKLEAANARAEMEAAREQMEAARIEMHEAARRLADASRQRIAWSGKNRAFLGVLIGGQSEDGIVVAGVTPAGGAETAGIEADDIIVAINGESLTGQDQPLDILHTVLDDVSPGGEVELTVFRDGETETYGVDTTPSVVHIEGQMPRLLERLGQAFDGPFPAAIATAAPIAGIRLMGSLGAGQLQLVDIGEDLGDYFGVDGGVLVLNAPGRSELKPGDVLRRVDGADVGSADEAKRLQAAASGNDAEVEVRRKNRKVDVTVAKGSDGMSYRVHAMPKGKATIIVDGPEVEVDVEVEKDDEE